MWAHYADNHKGVCLKINLLDLIKENEDVFNSYNVIHDKVEYSDLKLQFLPRILRGQAITNSAVFESRPDTVILKEKIRDESFLRNRFLTKNPDWKGESEYRFLLVNDDGEHPLLSIKNSLVRVILGINFSRHLLPSLYSNKYQEDYQGIDLNFRGEFSIKSLA